MKSTARRLLGRMASSERHFEGGIWASVMQRVG